MGGYFSRKFDPSTDLLDLKGKVIVVTGGNKGIGYHTVQHLARRGARVYLAARDESRATGAIAQLESEGLGPGHGDVVWLKLDLTNPRDAKKAAEDFLTRERRLDVLVNNAALLTHVYDKSQDGISSIMMVNHISPHIFTQTLLPLLTQTSKEPDSDVRIVTVSSAAHHRARAAVPGIHFRSTDDLNGEFPNDTWPVWSRYCVSKLANVLWTNTLQKQLITSDTAITCISLHPGEVNTFADRLPFPFLFGIIMGLFFKAPEEGAYNSCFAAASPLVRADPAKYKGVYLVPVGKIAEASENARNEDLGNELWATTEKILKELGL